MIFMKNILRSLFVLLCASTALQAQIILNSSGYTSVLGADSLKVTDSGSAFPSLAAMANGMWDMSVVTDSVPVHFLYKVADGAYSYADSAVYNFGGFGYQGNVNTSITSSGILEYGINIQLVAYSIATITSGPNDSFIILGQNMLYTAPRKKIALPATYHTSWSSAYSSDLDFQLSFLSATYNHAPGIVRQYTTEKDSVIGWGRMRVKEEDGTPSPYQYVLQVQTMIIHTDSFFLNGSVFSNALLTFFHLAEGQKDTTYEQNYYRPAEVTALAQIDFNDSAYTQPYTATTHVQRLRDATGVANIFNNTTVKVYPNPATNGSITLQLPSIPGVWSYELIDMNGSSAGSGPLSANGGLATVVLPLSLSAGIYYIKVSNNGTQVSVIPLEIAR